MKILQKLLVVAFVFASVSLTAQTFKSAIGARVGYPFSASYKMFLNESDAVEVYAGFRGWPGYSAIRIAGAYQRYNSFELDGEMAPLQWYWGAGASVAFINYKYDYLVDYGGVGIGVSGYLGLQYAFDDVPLELTIDWVPTINIGQTVLRNFGAGYGSLGVRYILSR